MYSGTHRRGAPGRHRLPTPRNQLLRDRAASTQPPTPDEIRSAAIKAEQTRALVDAEHLRALGYTIVVGLAAESEQALHGMRRHHSLLGNTPTDAIEGPYVLEGPDKELFAPAHAIAIWQKDTN